MLRSHDWLIACRAGLLVSAVLVLAPAALAQSLDSWPSFMQEGRGDGQTRAALPSVVAANQFDSRQPAGTIARQPASTPPPAQSAPPADTDGPEFGEPLYEIAPVFADQWIAQVGVIGWFRPGPQHQVLVDNSQGTPIVDVAQFGASSGTGLDVTVRRRFASGRGMLDFRYFDANASSSLGPIAGDNGSFMPISGGGTFTPNTFNSTLSSRLNSIELNLRVGRVPNRTAMIGIRRIGFIDRLTLGTDNTTYLFEVRDNLYGTQIGFERLWQPWSRLQLGLTHKYLLFGVDASNEIFGFAASTRSTCGLGLDVGATAALQLTKHWSARVGYQLLLLGLLATEPEQLAHVDLLSNNYPTITNNALLLQGITLGLGANW